MPNMFQQIDDINDVAPQNLKKEIVSEIDTMRSGMAVVSLFIGGFFSTFGASMSPPTESSTLKK